MKRLNLALRAINPRKASNLCGIPKTVPNPNAVLSHVPPQLPVLPQLQFISFLKAHPSVFGSYHRICVFVGIRLQKDSRDLDCM